MDEKRFGGGGGRNYPFSVRVFPLLVGSGKIYAVETADCERENELDEAECAVDHRANRELESILETHLEVLATSTGEFE